MSADDALALGAVLLVLAVGRVTNEMTTSLLAGVIVAILTSSSVAVAYVFVPVLIAHVYKVIVSK